MGVTSFREIRNNSPYIVRIRSVEKPQQTKGGWIELSAGDWRDDVDIWIPWCTSETEFVNKHLEIDVGGRRFTVWQQDINGVDRVRVSAGSSILARRKGVPEPVDAMALKVEDGVLCPT